MKLALPVASKPLNLGRRTKLALPVDTSTTSREEDKARPTGECISTYLPSSGCISTKTQSLLAALQKRLESREEDKARPTSGCISTQPQSLAPLPKRLQPREGRISIPPLQPATKPKQPHHESGPMPKWTAINNRRNLTSSNRARDPARDPAQSQAPCTKATHPPPQFRLLSCLR